MTWLCTSKEAIVGDTTILLEEIQNSLNLFRLQLIQGHKKNALMMAAYREIRINLAARLSAQLASIGRRFCEHEGYSLEEHGDLCRLCGASMWVEKPAEAGEQESGNATE
jgi:NAD-specific glutamate dehydrogenase